MNSIECLFSQNLTLPENSTEENLTQYITKWLSAHR